MRAERMEIMRLNGHNDQCTCAECGLAQGFPLTPLTAGEPASIGIELNDGPPDTRPPRERHGLPDDVAVRPRHYDADDRSMAEVYGEAEIVGTVELLDVPSHAQFVALEVRVRGNERWAIWWDRTTGDRGRMVARPIASRQLIASRPLRVEQG